jgi:hypothetical protein
MLRGVFLAKPVLNAFVGLVFLFGILICFLQLLQLIQSVRWIDDFVQSPAGARNYHPAAPAGPAGGAAAVARRADADLVDLARSILDSVGTRIDEQRDITRYLANLLIFLGLLGTFYGLATTVPGWSTPSARLPRRKTKRGSQVFDKLMSGLEGQLGGMGTAFSSSLLGLGGSLVVGLLELFVSHGTNRFYRELEEWIVHHHPPRLLRGKASRGAGFGRPAPMAARLTRWPSRWRPAGLYCKPTPRRWPRPMQGWRFPQLLDRLSERLDGMGSAQGAAAAHCRRAGQAGGGARLARKPARMPMPKAGCACGRSTCSFCAFLKKSRRAGRKA